MTTDPFETALVTAALSLAAEKGWGQFSVQDAARAADLSETEARRRFSCKTGIALALGRMADDAALADEAGYGSTRERLFDLLMRRIDVFQAHRPGVRALLKAMPFDPPMVLALGAATLQSMRQIAQAAGINASGLTGMARASALTAIWTATFHTWEKDDSPDMGRTMAALDQALDKAGRWGLFTSSNTAQDEDTGLPDLPDDTLADTNWPSGTTA
ncbi:MAG: TetR/AcrR family transcriptional regulator [Acetobacter papayae]|uniref:TetR family transcriptional regulator n=1 Tax=Acetobacter papayae TaxID=1076592 RepID=UPI0039E7A60C